MMLVNNICKSSYLRARSSACKGEKEKKRKNEWTNTTKMKAEPFKIVAGFRERVSRCLEITPRLLGYLSKLKKFDYCLFAQEVLFGEPEK